MNDISDFISERLIEKAISGDREAMTSLIEHPEMLQFLGKVSAWAAWKYKQDIDEVRQAILIKLYEDINTLRNPRALKHWCYSVAKSYCLNQIRHSNVERSYLNDMQRRSLGDRRRGGVPLIQSTDVPTPDLEFLFEEGVRRATKLFPKEIVDGWRMGKPPKEIAQDTGMPITTIYRILKNMQKGIIEGTLSEIKVIRELENGPGDKKISVELIHVIETVKRLTPDLIAYLQSHEIDLDKLRWDVFEHLVAEFFASWGFQDVRLVGRNSKTSADIFAAYFIDSIRLC